MPARLYGCLLSLLLLSPRPATSTTAAAQVPVDPRSLGLAGATLALPGGALSLRDNPASSATLARSEIAASHLSWLGGTFQDYLAGSFVLDGHGVLNAGLGYFSVPAFDSTDGRAAPVSAGLARADLGYALDLQGRMGSLSIGTLASYQDRRLDHLALADLGVSVGLAWHSPWRYLRLGTTVKRIGVYSSENTPPSPEFGLGIGTELERISADCDVIRQSEGQVQLRLGAEWRPLWGIALRLGGSNADAPGAGWALSTGLGLNWKGWDMGLAWQGRGELGPGMLLSLGTQWGSAPPAPAPLAEATPTAWPRERSFEQPKAIPATRPAPESASLWASGDFELQAAIDGQRVSLTWPQQSVGPAKTVVYEVLMGMVAEAPLQKAAHAAVQEPRWSEEMAVRGMLYYFRVRVLGQGGEQLSASKIKAVKMP